MKKILLFCLILLGTVTSAQANRQGLNQMRGIFFDTIVIPSGNSSDCYITYQTTCNRLVFVKDKDVFKSHFSLSIEAVDSLTGKVYREITDNNYSVRDFEETNSESRYVQGVVKLSIPSGSYKVVPVIYDYNTNSEHVLSQFDLKVTPPDARWALSPIVVKDAPADGAKAPQKSVLAGFDGNVPFSQEEYDMVIPVTDTNVTSIYVELKNNDTIIFKDSLKNSFVSSLSFKGEGESIAAEYNSNSRLTRNFVLPRFNEKLQEGLLNISLADAKKEKSLFRRSVTWYNKPRSLNNLDYAVKVLKNMDSGNDSRKDKAQNKMDYTQLVSYWKKFDPTPETAYNELMAEFYKRVDYAVTSFSLISNPDGADTDRGRVYIKFGKPKSVERFYSDSKDVREVWVYEEPKQQFIFVDKSGLGNFILSGKL